MRGVLRFTSAAVALGVAIGPAAIEPAISAPVAPRWQAPAVLPVLDLEPYLISRAPEGFTGIPVPPPATAATAAAAAAPAGPPPVSVEHEASLNGTLYAVIAPIYLGANGGTESYIRLFNGASVTSTFSVSIVGSPSGTVYGTAQISVPSNASPQYAINGVGGSPNIMGLAGVAGLQGSDTGVSLYIQNIQPAAGYQHVTFNPTTALFDNASVCAATLNQAIASVSNSAVLTNIHTTTLANYPSTLDIHNFWNAALTYKITVIDAASGNIQGQFQTTIGANSTYQVPFSTVQTAVGWSPLSTQDHGNIIVTDIAGNPPYEMISQAIQNNILNGSINMTTECAVNIPQSAQTSGGGGGLNGY